MATIYRFIVEQKASGGSGDSTKPRASKGAAKKGKNLPLFGFGGGKGGVEHNRKMRAINPILNKVTGGVWEKGMRLGRAGLGLVKFDAQTGAIAGLSGVAITIIISFVLQMLIKWQAWEREKASKINSQNYKSMENGFGGIHGAYNVSADIVTGRLTYNENK